jgi:hypothetical protein
MMFLGGTGPGDALRYYGGFVVFRGERFDPLPMVAELRRLLTLESYQPAPLRPPPRKPPAREGAKRPIRGFVSLERAARTHR